MFCTACAAVNPVAAARCLGCGRPLSRPGQPVGEIGRGKGGGRDARCRRGALLTVVPLLAVLAVGGVLAGILLRVRAFLFLGVSFLLLDVGTMIWHAAVDRYQTWVWWASGIVLGAAILGLFAVFEKRRTDVLRMVEDIRGWD